MMRFSARTTAYEGSPMLNICDADLLGSTVTGDGLSMSIGDYYRDRIVGSEEAGRLLEESHIINMVGRDVVSLSLELGIGIESGVRTIGGTPFLIVFKM